LYSAAVIALALAVWSIEEQTPAAVQARVSLWRRGGRQPSRTRPRQDLGRHQPG
jgi:hypothetical protein